MSSRRASDAAGAGVWLVTHRSLVARSDTMACMDLTDLAALMTGGLDERMGMEVLEVSPERTRGRMPVAGNTQPFGLWHGGASCVMAESLASIAAASAVGRGGQAFGVDLNATHHAPVRSGWVTGEARAIRIGGTLGTWEVVLTDDAGERVCTARVTCALKRPKP